MRTISVLFMLLRLRELKTKALVYLNYTTCTNEKRLTGLKTCFKVIFCCCCFRWNAVSVQVEHHTKLLYFSQNDYTKTSTLKGNLGINMHTYIQLYAYINIRIFTCIICTLKIHSSLLLQRKMKCSKFN